MINWRDPRKELPTQGEKVLIYFGKTEIWGESMDSHTFMDYKSDGSDYFISRIVAWVPMAEINLPEFGDK